MDNPDYMMADAHVHFYAAFDRTTFLDSAAANFRYWARQLHLPPETPGLLLLTERAQENYFARWSAGAEAADEKWTLRRTAEESSLVACRNDGSELYVIAGSQIATGDGLEVLALATTGEFPDGRPFRETLDSVIESDAITVLPWGFGKWSFGRGAQVTDVIESASPDELFLGDNSNRLRWGPRPKLFDVASARGFRILPGSDPLPFARHSKRAGSFGLALPGALDRQCPARSLRAALGVTQPLLYGGLETLPQFFVNQFALQWKKRAGSGHKTRTA